MEYKYQSIIKKVVDGDTVDVDINLGSLSQLSEILTTTPIAVDLGFSIHVSLPIAALIFDRQEEVWLRNQRLRLSGVNCPECQAADPAPGLAARGYARERLELGAIVTLQTLRVGSRTKQEKYGRYLGVIFLPDGTNFNQELIEKGFATPFMV